jgi:hypothetical protein
VLLIESSYSKSDHRLYTHTAQKDILKVVSDSVDVQVHMAHFSQSPRYCTHKSYISARVSGAAAQIAPAAAAAAAALRTSVAESTSEYCRTQWQHYRSYCWCKNDNRIKSSAVKFSNYLLSTVPPVSASQLQVSLLL